MKHWTDQLITLGACKDAIAWCKGQPSAAVAWRNCERADWMLWWIGKNPGETGGPTHRKLVRAACAIARTVEAWATANEAARADIVREYFPRLPRGK